MCEVYKRLLKDKCWRVVLEMLDEMYRRAEKAHLALPDSIKDIICSGVGRAVEYKDCQVEGHGEQPGVFIYWYYLPDEDVEEIYNRYLGRRRSAVMRKALGSAFLFYSPTSNRERFEEWKQRLSRFETLEEILAEYVT